MKTRDVLAVFNRGRISRHALARTDVTRVALSADIQTNWMPRTLGPMSLRPGLQYLGDLAANSRYVEFVYKLDDTAIIELNTSQIRIWDNGDTLVTRASVSSAVTNGTFTSDISGWTDADEAGCLSEWHAGGGDGVMRLLGTGYGSAKRQQEITVSGGDASTEHALRIVVTRGSAVLRVGTTAGDDDIFRQAVLRVGTHSIAFTPGGNFFIELSSSLQYATWVDSVAVESAGTLILPTPWTTVALNKKTRWVQSGDVLYAACEGVQQRRVERRPNNSWSIVKYEANNGPYLTENVEPIRLTPSGISGYITVTSSAPVFQSGHEGAIFRISSQGQLVEADLVVESTYSDPIRVTGVTNGRIFNVDIAGTWAGTVSLQRSVGDVGSWVTVATYTSNTSTTYDDGLDNSIVYYRLGVEAGNYTSGTMETSLTYDVGSITGVFRVTDYTSATEVGGIVLSALGGTAATEVWAEGAWSDVQGWPEAVEIYEGRLWWSGKGRNYASVSDAFSSFNPDIEGDSGPINRQIGPGVANNANWLLALDRLLIGTDGAEYSVRSTSFDEPVTPLNYNAKSVSTKGSAPVPAVSVDGRGYFVGRDTETVYELSFDTQTYKFKALNTTLLVPEIGSSGIIRMAVQQKPDVRVHVVRNDGTAAVLTVDEVEDVLCWVDVETDGNIRDVVVLPGEIEDRVFYRVRRDINGAAVRYHEEWAQQGQCIGGDVNRQADSFVVGAGAVTGLDHLEGETVVIWGDGVDQGTGVVSSGAVAGHSYTNWCAGLSYTAEYQSAKLAGQTQLGLSLTQYKRINKIGLILADTHAQGLEFGPDFDNMDNLPSTEDGAAIDEDEIYASYDEEMIVFPGTWETDGRLCLRATAPRPCTVLAAVLNVDRQDAD